MTSARQTPEGRIDLDGLFAQALADHRAGRLAEAAAAYRQILAQRPDLAEVRSNLGMLLWHTGQLEPAVAEFQQALSVKPDLADSYGSLAGALRERSELAAIAAGFEQALAAAYGKLGIELRQQSRFDEAATRLEQALALAPHRPEIHFNLGAIRWLQDRFEDALGCYERAVALKPDYAEALAALGHTLREQLRLAEAEQVFQRLLALEPDSPSGQSGLGICYLLQEDYQRGWPAFEGRLRIPGARPLPDIPRWRGEDLTGRSILVVAEAGFGDTLHFLRYARLLKARGARVVFAVQAGLGRLLATYPDIDELCILDTGRELPHCDFCLASLSLPGAFQTTTATIPGEVPYLWADPGLQEHWRRELAKIEGFKIGIAWQGSRGYVSHHWRSIPLACFAPLAAQSGVRLISLQKGFGSEQAATVDFPLLDFSDQLDHEAGPFMDTAAVITNLDLVITCDTGIGHLAGALGAPVWVAVNVSGDWRWLLGRDDTPWYPNMRLFRQRTFGQWGDVFEQIAQAVAERRSETARVKGEN